MGRLQNADPPRPIRRRGAGARRRAARGPQRRLSRVGTATPWPPSPGRPAARLERDRGLASATSAHRERVRARPSPPRSAGDFDQAETDGRDALRVATPTGSRTGRAGRVDGARVGADRSRRLRRDRRPARHARPHARGGLLGPRWTGTCWSPAATCGVARRGSPRRATTRGARRRSSGRRTRSTGSTCRCRARRRGARGGAGGRRAGRRGVPGCTTTSASRCARSAWPAAARAPSRSSARPGVSSAPRRRGGSTPRRSWTSGPRCAARAPPGGA